MTKSFQSFLNLGIKVSKIFHAEICPGELLSNLYSFREDSQYFDVSKPNKHFRVEDSPHFWIQSSKVVNSFEWLENEVGEIIRFFVSCLFFLTRGSSHICILIFKEILSLELLSLFLSVCLSGWARPRPDVTWRKVDHKVVQISTETIIFT